MIDIKIKPGSNDDNIRWIGIHHSGGIGNRYYASSQYLTANDVNNAHRQRWPNFPSELNGMFMGYNFFIDVTGKITQGRYIGEETAAQKGSNKNTISICLAGNFSKYQGEPVDVPKLAQINSLKEVLQW